MYFITTKRMLEVCFFQHTPTFIIEPKLIKRIKVIQLVKGATTAWLFFYQKSDRLEGEVSGEQ